MNYVCRRYSILLNAVLVLTLSIFTSSAMAEDTEMHQVVDGTAIYFGVLPAEMIRGHPKAHHQSQMHGGVPSDPSYHLTVAIFDAASGKRITNAKVTVKVVGSTGSDVQKELESMVIAGNISYGNYFRMPGASPYRIEIQIRRPASPAIIQATFDWGRS